MNHIGEIECARRALEKVRTSLPRRGNVEDTTGSPISRDDVQLAVNTVGNMLDNAEARLSLERARTAEKRLQSGWIARLVNPEATSGTQITAVMELAHIGKCASPTVPTPEDVYTWPLDTLKAIADRMVAEGYVARLFGRDPHEML